jgi:hypothetical protein
VAGVDVGEEAAPFATHEEGDELLDDGEVVVAEVALHLGEPRPQLGEVRCSDEVAVVKLLTKFIAISEAVLGAGPYLWAGHGPQSKGVGQWQ